MKIAFIISSINSKSNGNGGHYHSLLETVTQISKRHEVIIINIGNKAAGTLLNTKFKTYKILSKNSTVKTFKIFKKIIIEEKPDILHSFDVLAFYWTRILGRVRKIPFCLTKCGGENPKYYFPYVRNLIVYSRENEIFFKTNIKFKDSNLFLIPNRIQNFEDNQEGIRKIFNSLKAEDLDSFKFLRISRIGNYYRNSSLQLISLVKRLRSEGLNCCIIFIGIVEDNLCLKELMEEGKEYSYFFTSNEFTTNSKSFINCSDAVLGTGRSFMEAAAKGKILLSPIKNSSIPLLIKPSNFGKAFEFNFSERLILSDYDENRNYHSIIDTINKDLRQKQLKNFSNNVFSEFFDSKKIIEKHEIVYNQCKHQQKIYLFDFFLHTLFVIRSYLR